MAKPGNAGHVIARASTRGGRGLIISLLTLPSWTPGSHGRSFPPHEHWHCLAEPERPPARYAQKPSSSWRRDGGGGFSAVRLPAARRPTYLLRPDRGAATTCSLQSSGGDQVCWPTDFLSEHLDACAKQGLCLIKVHSHPGIYERFSERDDQSDLELFPSVYTWCGPRSPAHGSAVMLADGRIFGRLVSEDGNFFPFEVVRVAGADLSYWFGEDFDVLNSDSWSEVSVPESARRHAQAFGAGTYHALRRLSVAVIGYSGTGSPVVEQLARLGVGRLVLVDPDVVEEKNLNRIINTTSDDAGQARAKVEVATRSIAAMGLGTQVEAIQDDLGHPAVVSAVSGCDVIFGCMDSVDGRHLLNRLATFYNLAYFDVGVRLVADGAGGISQICGSVHYLQPGGSTLFSRGLYTAEQVRVAALHRNYPDQYQELLREKYISGVAEDRPAVISVNFLFAALAVNEFLARLHPYRLAGNSHIDAVTMSLSAELVETPSHPDPCPVLSRHLGRGDVCPLLDMPELSEP